ncbi:unnamed protein product [Arabidopsis lyrata]|nr:unnamed protein product [Arabidopsis lyrata]
MLVKHDNDDARDGPDFKTSRTCIHTGHNQCNELDSRDWKRNEVAHELM